MHPHKDSLLNCYPFSNNYSSSNRAK